MLTQPMNPDTHHRTVRAHPRSMCRRQIMPDLTKARAEIRIGMQRISRATVDLEDLLPVVLRVISSDTRKNMAFWVQLAGLSSGTCLKTRRRRSMRGPRRPPHRRMLVIIAITVTTATTVTMEVIMGVITAVTSVTSDTLDMTITTVTTDITGVEAIHDTATRTITEYTFKTFLT